MEPRRFVLVLVSIVLIAALGVPPAAATEPDPAWVRPVTGAVVRPFEAPRSRFGAGHRGADLAAARGTAVHAAGPGVVTFAGSVAGGLHVVVAHAGDLRTSYSFLATIAVRRGARVRAGDVVGTAGGTGSGHDGTVVHIGLRSGDEYVDPMLLFAPVDLASVVHLAPTTDPPRPASIAGERRGLVAGLVHAAGAAAAAVGRGAGAAISGGSAALLAVARDTARIGAVSFPMAAAVGRGVATWWSARGNCDAHAPGADGTGGSGHRVMIVAGIDSSSTRGSPSTALPAGRLGYEAGEVAYFSYAPDGGDYAPADTEGSLADAARRLGAQLRELQRREPGREVDLIGHSQGGVIVKEFLAHVYHRSDPAYPPLGTAVALASPFGGSPTATTAGRLSGALPGRVAMAAGRAGARRIGISLPDPESAATRELAEGSDFIRQLSQSRLPGLVELTAVGAATDVLVPAPLTVSRGAAHTTVVPHALNAHTGIVTDPSALRATRAALEQRPLPCRSLTSTVVGEVIATAILTGEHAAGRRVAFSFGAGTRP